MIRMYTNIKKTALIALSIIFMSTAIAQQDTVIVESVTTKKTISKDNLVGKQDLEITGEPIRFPRVFGGLTFSRIDWGFSRLIDDGSFTLSPENEFLEYKKASNFGFDIAQLGVRINDNFKTYVSAGFEWNYLRLKNNVLLNENSTPLSYTTPTDVTYRKNIFTTTYLRIPLTFELRSRKLQGGDRVKAAFGAMTGILMKGTQRLKSDELGKQKFKDTYNLATFQYGAFARIGYGDAGIFAKYYLNDMFENMPNQQRVNNLTFGITLGF